MTSKKCREEFEEWASSKGYDLEMIGNRYTNRDTVFAIEGWVAAHEKIKSQKRGKKNADK